MKKILLLVTAALTLSSCAPILSAVVPEPVVGSPTVALAKGDPQVITLAAGQVDTTSATLTLSGIKIAVGDMKRCKPVSEQIVCAIEPLKANTKITFNARGVIVVEATVNTVDGKTFKLQAD